MGSRLPDQVLVLVLVVGHDVDRRIDKLPAPVVVTDSLPRDTHHGWKFIAFGPDGRLYVPVGAPCNIWTQAIPMPPSCA